MPEEQPKENGETEKTLDHPAGWDAPSTIPPRL